MWIAHLSIFYLSIVNLFTYVRSSKMEGFVVGGDYAEIHQFPHSAYLAIGCKTIRSVENWSCGAAIINQRLLLTAAHCLENCLQSSFIGVGVGSEHKKQGLTYKASSFVTHPNYNPVLVHNDIALVHLEKPLTFSKNVKRVALVKNPAYLEPADVAGWGIVDEKKGTGTFVLKTAKQKVWKKNQCIKLLDRIPPGTFCADNGYPGKKKIGHAAEGDSGSALVIRGYIEIGLVSYKNPSVSKSVVVYTDVPYFLDWILDTSKMLHCNG